MANPRSFATVNHIRAVLELPYVSRVHGDLVLDAFAEFYSTFYNGERSYSLDPAKQTDLFDFPQFGITIVTFSSCYNNDLFNRQGAIHPACIADAGNRLRQAKYANRLRIAVWHHNTE